MYVRVLFTDCSSQIVLSSEVMRNLTKDTDSKNAIFFQYKELQSQVIFVFQSQRQPLPSIRVTRTESTF